jgi:hypothetical protein
MFKFLTIIISVFIFLSCDKQQEVVQLESDSTCYKGKLVLVGLCGNAVVQVLDERMPASFYEAVWKDESTGITFPDNLKQDEEFYFSINPPEGIDDCARCKAISPSPEKRQFIKICGPAK